MVMWRTSTILVWRGTSASAKRHESGRPLTLGTTTTHVGAEALVCPERSSANHQARVARTLLCAGTCALPNQSRSNARD